MLHERTPLNPGSLIMPSGSGEVSPLVIVGDPIGMGGSSIVYKAKKTEVVKTSSGITSQERFRIIKEFYPERLADCITRDETGSLVIASNHSDEFANFRAHFMDGYAKHIAFQEEAPNQTVSALGCFEANGTVYTVMEVADGATLDKLPPPSSAYEAVGIVFSLCQALIPYHDHKPDPLLHLDIKPENIYKLSDGERVKLFDFDTVQSLDAIHNGTAKLCFSEDWAAKEQRSGSNKKVCAATDIYAVGCVLFWLLMGRKPTNSEVAIGINWDIREKSRLCAGLTNSAIASLTRIFKHTLTHSPKKRYARLKDMMSELETLRECTRPGYSEHHDAIRTVGENVIVIKKMSRILLAVVPVCVVLAVAVSMIMSSRNGEANRSFEAPQYSVSDDSLDNSMKDIQITWGDNGGNQPGYLGRDIYTTSEIKSGILGDSITFNSIVDGDNDERKFVSARISGEQDADTNSSWSTEPIEVKDGEVYTIRMYVHNNNPNGYGYHATSTYTKAKFSLPTDISDKHEIRGYISSSNAAPTEYWSSVVLYSQTKSFSLEYVEGSATMKNAKTGSEGRGLPRYQNDSYFNIGYEFDDGDFPGGSQYACYISVDVRVVFQAEFEVRTTMRLQDIPDRSFHKTLEAQIGDLIECEFYYRNTSNETQNDVMVRYVLPTNLEYVPDSTKLYNSHYQEGVNVDNDTVTTSGINIGSYLADGNAYVRFLVKVVDNTMADGWNQLVTWGAATVENKVCKDDTSIMVNK